MKTSETIGLGCLVAIAGLFMLALVLSIQIVIVAGLAMLVCNWVLPMFDVQFPISFLQGCGIGVIVTIIRAFFVRVVTVSK